MRSHDAKPGLIGDKEISSMRQRINYVNRLNPKKARHLKDLYYRICNERRKLIASFDVDRRDEAEAAARVLHEQVERGEGPVAYKE